MTRQQSSTGQCQRRQSQGESFSLSVARLRGGRAGAITRKPVSHLTLGSSGTRPAWRSHFHLFPSYSSPSGVVVDGCPTWLNLVFKAAADVGEGVAEVVG